VFLSPLYLRAQTPANSLSQLQIQQPPVDVSSPVTATATFDPPDVRPGEKAFYRITFDATESVIKWPGTISSPAELKLRPVAHGQLTQNLGNKFRPLSSFLYEVQPAATGHFTIPGFVVKIGGEQVEVPAASLDVNDSASGAPARQLVLEVSTTNIFQGQPFPVRVLLPASPGNEVEALHEIQFHSDGFIVDNAAAHQTVQMTPLKDGRVVPAYIFGTTLMPIAAGTSKLSVQAFTAGREFIGPITISGQVVLRGGLPQYTLLVSDPVEVNVRPLPAAGRLPGFTGMVGKFIVDAPQLSTNRVHVGQPLQLTVNVHGDEHSSRPVPPPMPLVNDWQMFQNASGFSYTLIPLADTVQKTPAIPFSYFDPETEKYVDATILSVSIAVTGEELPTELPAVNTEASAPSLKLNDLSPTPGKAVSGLKPLQLRGWFICVQLLPVLGFFGLWQWDRRRLFLDAHPEIARRNQARRALRREKRRLQEAVASNNATAFVHHSANAMKIAVAPHYSAHPQALVCAEVLERLNVAERNSVAGETVRKIFAAADAQFASGSQPQTGWLASQPEVNAVLLKLEEQL
jgi:hypothetical protein